MGGRLIVVASVLALSGCGPSAEEIAAEQRQQAHSAAKEYVYTACRTKGAVAKALMLDIAKNKLTQAQALKEYGSVGGEDYSGLVYKLYRDRMVGALQYVESGALEELAEAYRERTYETCVTAGLEVIADRL